MNLVILCGNLGKNPTLKHTENSSVCHFSMATQRRWLNKEGEQQEETEWHEIVCWGALAKTCAKFLKKGRHVTVRGRMKTDKYFDDQANTNRWRTSVIADQVVFGSGAPDAQR